MTDLAVQWANGRPDLVFENGDLVLDESLMPAVLCSLFIDRRADEGDAIPDGTANRRGYWADTYNADGRQTGSRLWLFSREPALADLLPVVEGYYHEALAWLLDAGIALAVDVTVTIPAPQTIQPTVTLTLADAADLPVLLAIPEVLLS